MKISLNRILQYINWGSLILTLVLFLISEKSSYINHSTVLLSAILSIQIHVYLIYSLKKNNPLLLILSLQLVIYYALRISTLLFTNFSVVFLRVKEINFTDSNFALTFIVISNIFLFLGILVANRPSEKELENTLSIKRNKDFLLVGVLFFTYFLSFSEFLKIESLTRLTGFIQSVFFNPYTILFLCIIYFVYYYNLISKKIKIIIIFLLLLFVLIVSLNGSRSGMLTISVYFIIAYIVIHKRIRFKIFHIIGLAVVVPIAFIFFLLSTYVRSASIDNLSYSAKIEFAKSYDFDKIFNNKMAFAPVFDRIGFFDYATEIIAHKQQYSDIFTPQYYLASIVDNVLSPGFNIFNTPKVANALIYKYSHLGKPSLASVAENYQSDQLTIYGEYYSLFFGYGSLILFFFTGYFFQKLYNRKEKMSGVIGAIEKGFVLLVFYTLINSFGIDWLIFDIISIYVCYFLFRKVILINETTC